MFEMVIHTGKNTSVAPVTHASVEVCGIQIQIQWIRLGNLYGSAL